MSLSKHNKYMPTYDFPEEILSEIFKSLPVKYLLRCLSVQKSWYHLIKSPMFVSLHLNHQKLTVHDNPKYLLFHNTKNHTFTVCTDDVQCQEYCKLEYPFEFNGHEWCALSNGLICISSVLFRKPYYDPDIHIWNPLVQIRKTIRESPHSILTPEEIDWKALAFGYLPEVNDYVVVVAVKLEPDPPDPSDPDPPDPYEFNPNTVSIGVFSLNTSSWNFYFQDDVYICAILTDRSVFVNGIAFWVAENFSGYRVVMYFDTKTEIMRDILVPDWLRIEERQFNDPFIYPLFYPYNQSIAYFGKNDESRHLDMWVLKQDMIDEFSWEKKMSVSLSENVWADVLGIRNNGDIILAKSNNLISYDLDTHEPYDFVNSCDCLTPSSHYFKTPSSSYEEGFKPPFLITPFVETLLWRDIISSNTSD
ncbi:F-box domain-containing protein [Heracleum sosnowskyi]|uniref:F-box domain-containing protein n=1 Tax=Heracleum sosnowskyi TaxID=360622 RepID=A0AAD8MDP6_9APIA|nr:F-box domain-containing protein [Heracleum sosnowskyi]